jgi:hypothetical protein
MQLLSDVLFEINCWWQGPKDPDEELYFAAWEGNSKKVSEFIDFHKADKDCVPFDDVTCTTSLTELTFYLYAWMCILF